MDRDRVLAMTLRTTGSIGFVGFGNTRVAVPSDDEVREGIATRKAYGGSATRSSFAVLCALMEAEHREEAPARDHLTIEHIMPQKLTDEWKEALGSDAEDVHGRHRDRLANLTLSGDVTNSAMGTATFDAKRQVYRSSSIGVTRRVAREEEWEEEAIVRRAEDLSRRALKRWPWLDQDGPANQTKVAAARISWRIEDGPWQEESSASQMVLSVAGALLSLDQENAEKLSGEAISSNLHPASRYPPGSTVGSLTMRAVPGHDEYVLYPYRQDYRTSAEHCRKMGEICGVTVAVRFEEKTRTPAFWRFLKEHVGGLPGQKDTWRGPSQWTAPFNSRGDRVGIHVGNPEWVWLYIRSGQSQASEERAARMREYSWIVLEQMADQIVGESVEKNSVNGWSVAVNRRWTRYDEDEWPEVAEWLMGAMRKVARDYRRSGGKRGRASVGHDRGVRGKLADSSRAYSHAKSASRRSRIAPCRSPECPEDQKQVYSANPLRERTARRVPTFQHSRRGPRHGSE